MSFSKQSHQSSYRRIKGFTAQFIEPYGSQAYLKLTGQRLQNPNCTGTIITDLVVLTNAHCLLGVEAIEIGIGSDVFDKLTFYQGRYWVVHPIWHIHHLDLGLVVSVLRFRTVAASTPQVPRYWHTKDDLSQLASVITYCGWGIDNNNALGGLRCGQTPPVAPDQTCQKDLTDRQQEW